MSLEDPQWYGIAEIPTDNKMADFVRDRKALAPPRTELHRGLLWQKDAAR